MALAEHLRMEFEKEELEQFSASLKAGVFGHEDYGLEAALVEADPKLKRFWMMEHASVIMAGAHQRAFGNGHGWLRELLEGSVAVSPCGETRTDLRAEREIRRGRAILEAYLCRGTDPDDFGELRQVRSCLSIAASGALNTRGFHLSVAPFSKRNQRDREEIPTAFFLEHEFGRELAARYYQEVHDVKATVERRWRDGGRFESFPYWFVVFDLGPVDETMHRNRLEVGKKRKVREALLAGPRLKRARAERNVVGEIFAKHLGRVGGSCYSTVAEPAVALILEFLGCTEEWLSQFTFKPLR